MYPIKLRRCTQGYVRIDALLFMMIFLCVLETTPLVRIFLYVLETVQLAQLLITILQLPWRRPVRVLRLRLRSIDACAVHTARRAQRRDVLLLRERTGLRACHRTALSIDAHVTVARTRLLHITFSVPIPVPVPVPVSVHVTTALSSPHCLYC
jgi:hypothetical protein